MDLTDKLIQAGINYTKAVKALRELYYKGNPIPAKEFLEKLEPNFREDYTTPNQFLELSNGQQRILLKNIPLTKGDVFWDVKKDDFLILINDNKLLNIRLTFCINFSIDEIGTIYVPCYTLHQLWDFLENYTGLKVSILHNDVGYKVTQLGGNDYSNLGIGATKLEAIWNAIVKSL